MGAAPELEFRLTIAGAQENVTVSAAPALVETNPSAVSTLLDERAVAGQPATVQNSHKPTAERGPSGTDQRHRMVVALSAEPRLFHRGHELLGQMFNNWKISSVVNYGAGRPVNATVSGDPNQDGNHLNNRLPGYSRNPFTGRDYETTDLRHTKKIRVTECYKLNLMAESFSLFNRDNQGVAITSNGRVGTSSTFVQSSVTNGLRLTRAITNYPATS